MYIYIDIYVYIHEILETLGTRNTHTPRVFWGSVKVHQWSANHRFGLDVRAGGKQHVSCNHVLSQARLCHSSQSIRPEMGSGQGHNLASTVLYLSQARLGCVKLLSGKSFSIAGPPQDRVVHTVEHDPFIKSQLASRDQL